MSGNRSVEAVRVSPQSHGAHRPPPFVPHGEVPHSSPIFSEVLCALEFLELRFSPVYYGWDVPHGDGSGVIVIPGLLGMDVHLYELHAWLRRIGYRPFYSGIHFTADCPDRLSGRLHRTIDLACDHTGRPIHLVGHSLGGIFARSAAVRRPQQIASVITLGSPFRGLMVHRLVLELSHGVRGWIQSAYADIPRECGSSLCHCGFGQSLRHGWPPAVRQTAIYSRCDGVVDWRYCMSGKPGSDVEVVGTHLGMPVNSEVYRHIARRLAG